MPQMSILSRLIDRSVRVLLATLFIFVVVLQIGRLQGILRSAAQREAFGRLAFYAEVGAQVSFILFVSLLVALFLLRLEPLSKAKGLLPRLTAVSGTFLVIAIGFLPPAELGVAPSIIATAVTLAGNGASVYVLARLGRSFSINAEARKLVTSGPYAYVRHPLYLAEEIAFLGAVMHFFSLYAVLVLILHVFIQIQRMKNEEAVLLDAYPEYADYQAGTARLIPHVY
jgi:protein-S-isoprenylcysteine O-methyltransferase Ste14